MGLNIQRCFSATCDVCGKSFDVDNGDSESHFDCENELIEALKTAGWVVDDKCLCPSCRVNN